MKKNILLISIIITVFAILFVCYFIFADKYELFTVDETYFYKEDIDETVGEQSGGVTLANAYDNSRYRKYKICCEYALVEGSCVTRLKDAEGNIIKEWDTNGESFKEVIDKSLFEKADEIVTISEDKNCVGVCKIEIYGKRTHLLNLKHFFDD